MSLRMMVAVAATCALIPLVVACDRRHESHHPRRRARLRRHATRCSTAPSATRAAATKHAFIRQNDVQAPMAEGQQFVWRLVDGSGHQAAAGRAAYSGTAWGIPLWTIDFSKTRGTGNYRLIVEGAERAPRVHDVQHRQVRALAAHVHRARARCQRRPRGADRAGQRLLRRQQPRRVPPSRTPTTCTACLQAYEARRSSLSETAAAATRAEPSTAPPTTSS